MTCLNKFGYRLDQFKGIVIRALFTAVFIGVLATAISSRADQVTTAPAFGPWFADPYGEFTVTPDAGVAAQLGTYSPFTMNQIGGGQFLNFQTFCIERNEYITPNTTYDVTFNNITRFSGVPLSAGVAYLYQQFATGALPYDYTDTPAGGRTTVGFADAVMLQNAIWYLMGEYAGQAGNPYVVLADAALGGPAASFAPDNGARGVKVLNLWAPGQPHDQQHAFQDLLIYTVPEPSAFALVSIATLLLLRRRK